MGCSRVRRLGGDRAGEIGITRFLRNRAVTVDEMVENAAARTAGRVAGLHVLAIEDTTNLRIDAQSCGSVLHPVIAVDVASHALLGLVHAQIIYRHGGQRATRKQRGFDAKESARWLDGATKAADLIEQGAARVTVVADREGDIFEMFALRPAGIDLVVRAGQDRQLAGEAGKECLFAKAAALPCAGTTTVDLPAAAGRKARQARLEVRFDRIRIVRPVRRGRQHGQRILPDHVDLTVVEAREIGEAASTAPAHTPAHTPAHWRLLTTHSVNDLADAERILGFYRQRWTIEQLFRTMKSKGFDVEAMRIAADEPYEKLAIAVLIAAISVLQLVHERDAAGPSPMLSMPKTLKSFNTSRSVSKAKALAKKPAPAHFARLRDMGDRPPRRMDWFLR